jgi:hypothetical protein
MEGAGGGGGGGGGVGGLSKEQRQAGEGEREGEEKERIAATWQQHGSMPARSRPSECMASGPTGQARPRGI